MITRLIGYDAEAEVLGQVRKIQVAEESITIFGVDVAEAGRILDRLSAGGIEAVKLATGEVDPEDAPCGCADQGECGQCPGPGRLAVKSVPAPVAQALPGFAVAAETAPAAVAPREQTQEAIPTVAAPAVAVAPATDAPPPELSAAKRMREVVDYLVGTGLKTPEEVTAACEKYRDASPVIQRVANLAERVTRLMAVEG